MIKYDVPEKLNLSNFKLRFRLTVRNMALFVGAKNVSEPPGVGRGACKPARTSRTSQLARIQALQCIKHNSTIIAHSV